MIRDASRLWHALTVVVLALGAACDRSPLQLPQGEKVISIVSGDQQDAPVGARLPEPLTVTILDGAPVVGARVAWAVTSGSGTLSADTTTSPASGVCQVWLTLGPNAGPVSVTATLVGTTRQVTFTAQAIAGPPPPPPPAPWPNEPANFTFVNDEPFSALNENGWLEQQRQVIGDGLGVFLASDPLAPLSPPSVLAFAYPIGFVAGREPGVAFYRLPAPVRETYFGFWWKPSNPWQNNEDSNANKIAFMFPLNNGVEGDIFIMMYNTPAGYTIQVEPEYGGVDVRRMPPNVTATPVTLGSWHRIEWYVKNATTTSSRDGVTRWWLDGILQGDYADLQTPDDAGVIEYQLAPTWGGVVGVKSEADTFWFDHARVSHP